MSDSREQVLTDIRAALNRAGPIPDSVAHSLQGRLSRPRPNIKPSIGADAVAHFIEQLQSVSGKLTRVASIDKVADVVAAHLRSYDLGDAIVVAPDPSLEGIPWSNRLRVEQRAGAGTDRVTVTGAYAAVAETGSVVLLSSAESPTVRMRNDKRAMPRTVNFITGPSKTADVEQTIQEGAHGPRRLHVILVAA